MGSSSVFKLHESSCFPLCTLMAEVLLTITDHLILVSQAVVFSIAQNQSQKTEATYQTSHTVNGEHYALSHWQCCVALALN